MQPKTDQIRAAWAAGDQIRALRTAARFFDRSADTRAFKRGMDAYNNPSFYRQLGKEPEQLTAAALKLLARKFSLQPTAHSPEGWTSRWLTELQCPFGALRSAAGRGHYIH